MVAQLVEQLLPTPEIRGSNLVIYQSYNRIKEKAKIKKKRPGMVHLKKILVSQHCKLQSSSFLAWPELVVPSTFDGFCEIQIGSCNIINHTKVFFLH